MEYLEVDRGDVVYLHTSFSRLAYLAMRPNEFLDALISYLGSSSTLVLPSFAWNIDATQRPWKGYADYYRSRPIFDVRHTPANIGVVPEIFRSRPGVRRSALYWWSIAALGPMADILTDRQHEIEHPYSPESAFGRLEAQGAKVVGLGVSLNTTSLAPVADYQLGDRHPQVIFSEAPQEGIVVDADGHAIATRSYWLLPEVVRLIQPSEVIARSGGLGGGLRRLDIGDTTHFAYHAADYTRTAVQLAAEPAAQAARVPWLERYPVMKNGTRKGS
ncbi:MAG: AAC(3) family N-acetyltransferase [Bryobacteraceae bacterium]